MSSFRHAQVATGVQSKDQAPVERSKEASSPKGTLLRARARSRLRECTAVRPPFLFALEKDFLTIVKISSFFLQYACRTPFVP